MEKFYSKLEQTLKTDLRFVDTDGDLFKNEVIDKAYKADVKLIEMLLSDKELEEKFFSKIKTHSVFNINGFVAYVQDKNFLNDSYTKFKNKIGLNIDGKFLNERKEVVLVWPCKDCVLEGGMTKEDQKRKEIFFNEILAHDDIDKLFASKVLIDWKRYTKNGEEAVKELKRDSDGTIRENLIIKGNNLVALHTLKTQFQEKVKLIYIDPPYNTGSDSFGYNDNFNHSTWLTFMKNRLEVAKELLTKDGSLWVNIDDDESHYLKILLDEVFGRENFIANIVWKKKYSPQNDAKYFSDMHDHILVFAKSKDNFKVNLLPRSEDMNSRYKNPDNDPRGDWKSSDFSVKTYSKDYDYPIKLPSGRIVNPPKSRCWRTSKEKFNELVKDSRIWFGENRDAVPSIKRFLTEVQDGSTPQTIWDYSEVSHNQDARKEITELFKEDDSDFSTPKPEKLMQRIIHIGSNESDIILVDSETLLDEEVSTHKQDGKHSLKYDSISQKSVGMS